MKKVRMTHKATTAYIDENGVLHIVEEEHVVYDSGEDESEE